MLSLIDGWRILHMSMLTSHLESFRRNSLIVELSRSPQLVDNHKAITQWSFIACLSVHFKAKQ